MVEADALQTLAEFGIALAGFTSIVVVFRRGGGDFHPADRYRVFVALVPSLSAAFLALIPVGLDLVGLHPATVWRTSSLVLVAAVTSIFVTNLIQERRLPPEARTVLSRLLTAFFRVVMGITILAGLINATDILFPPQAGLYFFAVLWLLAIASIVFVRIVFVRPAAQ